MKIEALLPILFLTVFAHSAGVYHGTGSFPAYTALDITASGGDGSGDIYMIPDFGAQLSYIGDVPYSSSNIFVSSQVYRSTDCNEVIGQNNIPGLSQLAVIDLNSGLNGAIINSGDNYIGFSLTGDPDQTATPVYGWARFELGTAYSDSSQMKIVEWAYDTAGEPLAIGKTTSVPEPSALGLSLLAASSLLLCRNRVARS